MDDPVTKILIAFLALVLGVPILIGLVLFFTEFSNQSRYLKMEIHRTDGEERTYWQRELRHHYLSLIPFVRFRQD